MWAAIIKTGCEKKSKAVLDSQLTADCVKKCHNILSVAESLMFIKQTSVSPLSVWHATVFFFNHSVAAIAQSPVTQISLIDLDGCCSEWRLQPELLEPLVFNQKGLTDRNYHRQTDGVEGWAGSHDLYVATKLGFTQQKRAMVNGRNLLHQPFGFAKRTFTAGMCVLT